MTVNIEDNIRSIVLAEVEKVMGPFKRALLAFGASLNGSQQMRPEVAQVHDFGLDRSSERVRPLPFDECAIIGCKKPHRSKGFCATHYQKYRNLEKTNRLPSSWIGAGPQSVMNFALPRGAAGRKAVKAARTKKALYPRRSARP